MATKNAQIWQLVHMKYPLVKIEYTLYIPSPISNGKNLYEVDAGESWNGIKHPKGAKKLATIKVPDNTLKSATAAYNKWRK